MQTNLELSHLHRAMRYWKRTFITLIIIILVAGCGSQANEGEALAPTDEEQIKTLVENYFSRDPNIPEYEANVEAVVDNWARVSLSTEGVDSTDKILIYLQDQVNAPEPAPTVDLEISDELYDAESETELGWAIITKPQAYFTDEELDAAMVPESIRP